MTDESCPICLAEFDNVHVIAYHLDGCVPPALHLICLACAVRMRHPICPQCARPFVVMDSKSGLTEPVTRIERSWVGQPGDCLDVYSISRPICVDSELSSIAMCSSAPMEDTHTCLIANAKTTEYFTLVARVRCGPGPVVMQEGVTSRVLLRLIAQFCVATTLAWMWELVGVLGLLVVLFLVPTSFKVPCLVLFCMYFVVVCLPELCLLVCVFIAHLGEH